MGKVLRELPIESVGLARSLKAGKLTKRRSYLPRPDILILLLFLLFSGFRPIAQAQELSLQVMPSSTVNEGQGWIDLYQMRRPAMSIIGFDNTEEGYNAHHGLGLKQILEMRYNSPEDFLTAEVYDRIIEFAHQEQSDPYALERLSERRIQLERNTVILSSRVFEALATFVLELNGYDSATFGLLPHAEVMARLKQAFTSPPGGVLIGGEDIVDDLVKYGRAIGNVARAIDLYLALENAYAQAPGNSDASLLLTFEQKAQVLGEYGAVLLSIDRILEARAVDVYSGDIPLPPGFPWLQDLLVTLIGWLPSGDRVVEEVEPGNWAMKQRVAIGYGAMIMQVMDADDPEVQEQADALRALGAKAIRSVEVVGETNDDRLRHWNFMTRGGNRFWAESPYYLDFGLEQVLPFWHVLRANNMLPVSSSDPFRSAWFTNPLHWHADLATPDGRIAPLDDGNKAPVRYAGLMRWTGDYGDEELGRKYAWIDERLDGPARKSETLLVELAIPRTTTEQPPVALVGNPPGPIVPHVSEQQLVLRNTALSGHTHYLLLNGEHGEAVDRGEGHEQPDQLQLLYYRDDLSYLLDSGYDQAGTTFNSSWNHYFDHNVLTAGGGEGGLLPPELSLVEVRKKSEPSSMGEASELYHEEHGAVTVLHGMQRLKVTPGFLYQADYTRDVLFVSGPDPYLIDLNRASHGLRPLTCSSRRFYVNYYPNSDNSVVPSGYNPREHGFLKWDRIGEREGRTLKAFPMSIEFDLASSHIEIVPDSVMEREGLNENEEGVEGKQLTYTHNLVLHNSSWCEPYWTVATLFRITDDNPSTESQPALVWSGNEVNEKQGWVWPQGDDIFDVFVARSVRSLETPVQFSPEEVDPEFPDLALILPEGAPYGYARLERSDGGWHIHPDYRIGLEEDEGTQTSSEDLAGDLTVEERDEIKSYPNPFNPLTHLTLRLSKSQEVTLTIYNTLGQRMMTLHRGPMDSGRIHTFEVDGSQWSSGLYLVRVDGENFQAVHRLMLVK